MTSKYGVYYEYIWIYHILSKLSFFFLMSNAVDNSIFYVFVMMSSLRTKGTVVVLVCFFAHKTITVLLSTTFSYCLMDGLLNKHSQ